MATWLKNLKIKKVDFVDDGANPEADILIYKNKDGIPNTAKQTDKAEQTEGILHRLAGAIEKALKIKPDELNAALEEIKKGGEAETFSEKIKERSKGKIYDEIWDLCFALQSSLCSIVVDDIDNKKEFMDKSMEEFQNVMSASFGNWASGALANVTKKNPKAAELELEMLKSAQNRIKSRIEKSEKKEGEESMIDKNLMTPAEKAFYEDIEKRCSSAKTEETSVNGLEDNPITKAVEKTEDNNPVITKKTQEDGARDEESIYKGLHPVVAAELKELRKRADAAEEKELFQIAKKYEMIGKKPEELVPVLKNLKHTDESIYNDTIAILDATVSAVNKSGVFDEIGKGTSGSDGSMESVVKANAKVAELRKMRPELSEAQALDEVLLSDEQLRNELDQ